MEYNLVFKQTSDEKNQTAVKRESDLLMLSMITD